VIANSPLWAQEVRHYDCLGYNTKHRCRGLVGFGVPEGASGVQQGLLGFPGPAKTRTTDSLLPFSLDEAMPAVVRNCWL
jgi:hypothetical protein